MNNLQPLFIFTTGYPYGNLEYTFLDPEIAYLTKKFQVTLFPAQINGERRALPPGVAVEEGYARFLAEHTSKKTTLSRALRSRRFYSEFGQNLPRLLNVKNLGRLVRMVSRSQLTCEWLSEYLAQNDLNGKAALCYTYWLEQYTLGIGLAKPNHPQIRLLSRAHRYDLYNELHPHRYMPLQAEMLKGLDRLVLISDQGKEYIDRLFPWISPRSRVSRLGIQDPGFRSKPSTDGCLRFVSCSWVRPVKRVDQIALGLCRAAAQAPAQRMDWTHFGDGPQLEQVKEQVRASAPPNLTVHLPGAVQNHKIMDFYRTQPVDLFINASLSEGIPVSLMEAAACAIPLMATAVGGNPEIVRAENGYLLLPGAGGAEISAGLGEILRRPEGLKERGLASRRLWEQRYNIAENAPQFIQTLEALVP